MTDALHFDERMALGLVTNTLSSQDRNRAIRHLLRGCQSCRERVRNAAFAAEGVEEHYGELLGGLGKMSLVTTQLLKSLDGPMGRLLWPPLERASSDRRLAIAKGDPRYHAYGVFQAALRAVRKRSKQDPREAVELAHLALALAELADPEVGPADELRFDWRAYALVCLAGAQKAAGDFRAAQSALDLADSYLSWGTQDPVDRAMFFIGKGGLFHDLGRFEDSVEILDRAFTLFRRVGDHNGAGKVRLQQAAVLQLIDPERGLAIVEEGLAMIDLKAEPRAEWAGRHTQAHCYNELGEPEEAGSILQTYRYLSNQFPDFEVQGSREWLCAKVCIRLGRLAEAEQRLRRVQADYLERGFRQEAVLTSVDLVELLASERRTGEALSIAQELFPILQAWGLHRDTLALVSLVTEALEKETLEVGVFREVALQLRRKWYLNAAG